MNDDGDILTLLSGRHLNREPDVWIERISKTTAGDVEQALAEPAGAYRFERLLALVSPAARQYMERMAELAKRVTIQRFGRTIRLYAPLYLSSYCVNRCRYCGFNVESRSERRRLSVDEAVAEAEIIASEGFRDLLLVSSEDREHVSVDYLCELAARLKGRFSAISVEIYQLNEAEYARLFAAGVEGVTLYQETYDKRVYRQYHLGGPKADYERRLRGPDDMGRAGMREIGLGVLLGLADWRVETLALAEHAHYLMKQYWKSRVSISFPRLRPAHDVGKEQFEHLLSDADLVQMMLGLRLCFADVGLVLSTRERAQLRDNLVALGITRMSAGSKTSPGGYAGGAPTVEQFSIDDSRSPAEVAAMIKDKGYEAVWKDWDAAFIQT
jgi:2-iminoacetate synthase